MTHEEALKKSCGNCKNCSKDSPNLWVCEEYGFYHGGVPVHCEPPNDEPCDLWTDDESKANSWERYV